MNEELTREVLEALKRCNGADCHGCPAQKICRSCVGIGTIQRLATSLLAEMDKPKVWDGAPELATIADIYWSNNWGHDLTSKRYTRELPKTRARIIAEEIVRGINDEIYSDTKDIEYVEGVLKRYAEELKGEA